MDIKRRRLIQGAGSSLAALLLPAARAQTREDFFQQFDSDALVRKITGGAAARRARVKLELPDLADNGNSVPMKLRVESPMTEADHVKTVRLLSERNPELEMAKFHLGPHAGVAEVHSRVRLAGSQRVVALVEMSDGSFWMDTADVVVTLSACLDGAG
jgi:sulfur-oxidizing protein SoxY